MTLYKARILAQQCRSNIGRLLYLCGVLKKDRHPHNTTQEKRYRSEILANMADLKRLYEKFPEIKPIKVKQLNLFSRIRDHQLITMDVSQVFKHRGVADHFEDCFIPESDPAEVFLNSLQGV